MASRRACRRLKYRVQSPGADGISPKPLDFRLGMVCSGAGIFSALESASERVAVGLAGPDPQGVIDRRHEYLAVTDVAGARARGDDFNRLVGEIGCDGDFDPQLRQKIHDIFGAAIDFSMALLAAVTLDLGYRHAVDADGGQRLAHLVKLEGFDNGNDELHGQAFIFSGPFGRDMICDLASLASFHANGTKRLQAQPKNDCGGSPLLASLSAGAPIIQQNPISSPAVWPARYKPKGMKWRTDPGFSHSKASSRALIRKLSYASSSPTEWLRRRRWSGPRAWRTGKKREKFQSCCPTPRDLRPLRARAYFRKAAPRQTDRSRSISVSGRCSGERCCCSSVSCW